MKRLKLKVAILAVIAMTMFMSVNVLADVGIDALSGSGINLAESIGTGLNSIVGEVMAIIAVVLPIALTLVGAVIAIRKGIRLMRSLVSG